jgi:hypothetical protein
MTRMTAQPTYEINHRHDLKGPARVADLTLLSQPFITSISRKSPELLPGQFLGNWAAEPANLGTNIRWGINE